MDTSQERNICTSVSFIKLPKVNSQPMGKNSPNLVPLASFRFENEMFPEISRSELLLLHFRLGILSWSQSYDRELERQHCKKLEHREKPGAF
jgi:hypothetical protein